MIRHTHNASSNNFVNPLPPIQEGSLDWSIHTLRREIGQLKNEINSSKIAHGDLGPDLILWINLFDEALKNSKSKASNESDFLEILEDQFIDSLQEFLTDPISDEPLEGDAVLGSDGYTYNLKSLEQYKENASEKFKNRSPMDPENPKPFTTTPQPLLSPLSNYLSKKGISLKNSVEPKEGIPARIFLVKPIAKTSSSTATYSTTSPARLAKSYRRESTLRQNLERLEGRYEILQITGDGHCLFRAIAASLAATGNFEKALDHIALKFPSLKEECDKIRALLSNNQGTSDQVVAFLRKVAALQNKNKDLSGFMEGRTQEEYLNLMGNMEGAHWGGDIEIIALVEALSLQINIVDASIASDNEIHINTYIAPGENLLEVNLLFRPGHYDSLLSPKQASSNPPISRAEELKKEVSRLSKLQLDSVNPSSEVPASLQVNVLRRRLHAELATIERLLSTPTPLKDPVSNALRDWVREFRKKTDAIPFHAEEKLLELLSEELTALCISITEAKAPKEEKAPHHEPDILLTVDVLRRQSYAELTGIEKVLKKNSGLHDDLTLAITDWAARFRSALHSMSSSKDTDFLPNLVKEFTDLLQKILQDPATGEPLDKTGEHPILEPVLSYLKRQESRYTPMPTPQANAAPPKAAPSKASSRAEKVRRFKANLEAEEAAKAAAKKEDTAKKKEKIKVDVAAAEAKGFSENIDPIFENMQQKTAEATENVHKMSEEDQVKMDNLEKKLDDLEEDLKARKTRNADIDEELHNLGDNISEAEKEVLHLEKTLNDLEIAIQQHKKRKKQSIWRSIACLGLCVLGSYGLSSATGQDIAITPGQGKGPIIHTRFPI